MSKIILLLIFVIIDQSLNGEIRYLKENKTGKEAIYQTGFQIDKTEDKLIVVFKAEHSTFNSYSDKYNDKLYMGDVCEIFIDVGEKDHYYEIEVAPNNAVFFGNIKNNKEGMDCEFIEENFLDTSVTKTNDSYQVTIIIPLEKIHYDESYGIKFNAFRIETDGEEPEKYLFALNPTMGPSFHKPEAFIPLK